MTDAMLEQPAKAAAPPILPVAAGSPSIDPALEYLLGNLTNKRKIAMAISDFTSGALVNPQQYVEHGAIEEAPLQIDAGQANVLVAFEVLGTSDGTAAVATYDIKDSEGDSEYKLAVLWSIPSGYAKHSNRFNFALLDVGAGIDQDLYQQMFKGAASAEDGEFGIEDQAKGFQVSGVMSTGGEATFKVEFRSYPDG